MSLKVYHTDYLFPKSDFIVGAGSAFNIWGNYFDFNYSENEDESDLKALENDWGIIGRDIWDALIMEAKRINSAGKVSK